MKKAPKPISNIGIIANSGKISSRSLVRDTVEFIEKNGRTVLTDPATAALSSLDVETCANAYLLTKRVDILLVFGGDGTMLQVAHDMKGAKTPVLGINVGGLGFLTDVPATGFRSALSQIWSGQYTLEPRAMIEATGEAAGARVHSFALNDFVISRGIVSRLIDLDVTVDNETLTQYRCDGLIVSSPTGSTAYSLAAGGAVVYPKAEVFTITPICPHTLSNRSVIVGLDSTIQVTVISEKPDTVLSADGQVLSELRIGDTITVRRSRNSINLVRLPGSSFFETLRLKLNWRGSHVTAR